ncbi:helix-turn-helix domain-containing protein, partial [Streptomyces microflavus]|uniref:helix-turn-helix domain-containing protein n=1 Tax=Streptomyces microflavus TaxID=1919 RepID=UPI0033AAB810
SPGRLRACRAGRRRTGRWRRAPRRRRRAPPGLYFAQGASLTRTKTLLHVHVNTVVQRLERIGRLLGPDWNEPPRTLEIQLALRLHRLTQGL